MPERTSASQAATRQPLRAHPGLRRPPTTAAASPEKPTTPRTPKAPRVWRASGGVKATRHQR
eukprot:3261044-Alexandrium_andersonii.AAC.1